MKKTTQWIIQWTWGIIQNLIGLVLYIILSKKGKRGMYGHAALTEWSSNQGSMSMGMFLFVTSREENLMKHEYGHSLQSIILGPLWLFVMGIPSLIWASCFDKYRQKHNVSYYSFYTEKSADKLGGVVR